MKNKNFNNKILGSVTLALFLTLLSACQNEAQTTSTANDNNAVATGNDTSNSIATDAGTDESDITAVNTTAKVNNTSQNQQSLTASEFSEFNTVLQGSWERVDYPYDTIDFDNNQVKFTAGEGAAEPAQFEDFKVSDTCPKNIDAEASALAYDFLVIADKRCEAIKINGNKLTLDYSGTSKGIEYKRMGKPSADATSALNVIPNNFYGKWVDEKANCMSDNPLRLEITANKILFFENEAKLVKVKQWEPTRLEADFDYLRVEADLENPDDKTHRKPYFNTLDLQNNSKELIMRENGAAPIKSIKCD